MSLTAAEVLSRRSLDTKLTKLLKQERKYEAEITRRDAELKKELDGTDNTNARLKKLRKETVRTRSVEWKK